MPIVKGPFRSIGDAGASPTNKTGKTMLKLLDDILTQVTGQYKSLADGQLPVTKTTLYTCPADTQTIIKTITLVNTDATARTVNLYINTGVSRRIIPKNMELGISYSFIFDDELTLEAGDLIEGDASAANVVDYTINGVEQA